MAAAKNLEPVITGIGNTSEKVICASKLLARTATIRLKAVPVKEGTLVGEMPRLTVRLYKKVDRKKRFDRVE
jgi:hypothetical protein